MYGYQGERGGGVAKKIKKKKKEEMRILGAQYHLNIFHSGVL